MILPKVDPKMILNPVIDCNMPPYPEECIIRANKDRSISDDFTKSRAYEVGYRINPMTPGLAVMTYSKFGDEIFEFGSSAFDAPEGAIRSNYEEYKNYMDNLVIEQKLFGSEDNTPNPADDFIDNFVPQTLPTFGNLKNESFIKPAPFVELDPENNFLLPSLIGLILIGYFILK
mgnify:CR=1 FL=1|jgi:hypothetical protein|tara:strand:- start:201 stop:722 length:522 start_codon:yes stop_codon:yes gene_type:complete